MSPIKEISTEQAVEVFKWISSKAQGVGIAERGEGETVVFAHVGGEPLMVFHNTMLDRRTLSCSETHGRELEQAGIVRFSSPASAKDTSPSNQGINSTLDDNRGCA